MIRPQDTEVTLMRIPTNADYFNSQFRFMFFGTEALEAKPQTDADGNPKLVEGKPVYSVPVVAIDKTSGRQENLSVKVFTDPSGLQQNLDLTLKGTVLVTPWLNGKRISYSLIAESIAPRGDAK